jgi:alpha-ketoglutarate-dependent taurine dioxygenase
MTMRTSTLTAGGPLVVEPATSRDLAEVVAGDRDRVDDMLRTTGALLFRGFAVGDADEFARVVSALSPEPLDYVYRSTPRSAVTAGVFTTTEYPPAQEVTLHCENAYQRQWPRRLAFCCLTPAATGGETPVADLRAVTAAIGAELVDRFAERGVRYVRHYRPHVDLSWQDVFQTTSRAELAEFCAANDIEHEWLDEQTLRTAQVSQGVATHPDTGERVFFNQAHLFHVSNLPPEPAAALVSLFGAGRLPRNAYYGDGGELDPSDLDRVRDAFREAAIAFPWAAGDVLLIDNMRMAHGRRPFTGTRKVVASLMDLHSPG